MRIQLPPVLTRAGVLYYTGQVYAISVAWHELRLGSTWCAADTPPSQVKENLMDVSRLDVELTMIVCTLAIVTAIIHWYVICAVICLVLVVVFILGMKKLMKEDT